MLIIVVSKIVKRLSLNVRQSLVFTYIDCHPSCPKMVHRGMGTVCTS